MLTVLLYLLTVSQYSVRNVRLSDKGKEIGAINPAAEP